MKVEVIRFNTRLYGRSAIIQAGRDFTGSCWLTMEQDGEDILVSMLPKFASDIVKLKSEFSNYVLGIMQNALF